MSLLQKSQSVELSRRSQPFYAKRTSYTIGSASQVQIEIDTQREFLDFENGRLLYDLIVVNTTAATTFNEWVGGQIIENLRVKTLSGQMIGHEMRQYRTAWTVFKQLKSNNENMTSYEAEMEGASGPAIIIGDTTVEVAHRIEAHIFGLRDYYPAHFHQGLMIEFDLPSSVNDLVLASANITSITLSNPRYVVDLVQLKPEIENEMVRLMEEQKLFVDYIEWLEQENALDSGAKSANFDIVGIDGRVKSAFTFRMKDSDFTSTSASIYNNYGRNNLSKYRYKLGSRYLNYAGIECNGADRNAQQIFELLKALDYHSADSYIEKAGSSTLLTPALMNSNKFVCGIKVDKSMKDVDEVISSQVDKDRNNMRVELTYSASLAAASTVYSIVVLDKRLQLLPGSIVRSVRS